MFFKRKIINKLILKRKVKRRSLSRKHKKNIRYLFISSVFTENIYLFLDTASNTL